MFPKQENDSLKFFSPQRDFKTILSKATRQYTPNNTVNKKTVVQSTLLEREVDKVSKSFDNCLSDLSKLKEKLRNSPLSDENSKKNLEYSLNPNNNDNLPSNIENYGNNLNNVNNIEKNREFGLVLKEWKIMKTNEMIDRFESQMQVLLRENDKLMKISKQRQSEIDRLKSSDFINSCKLKEFESKIDILKEELDHNILLLREKDEDLESWKMKFFENEQKVSALDSLEFRLMENEYLLLDYQKRIETLIEEDDNLRNSNDFIEINEKLIFLINDLYKLVNISQKKKPLFTIMKIMRIS